MNINSKQKISMIGIVATMVLVSGCQNKAVSSVAQEPIMETEVIQEISAWGEVKYGTMYQLNIDFPATVESIAVKEGDFIHKDESLAMLDTIEFDSSIAKLEDKKSALEAALNGTYQDPSGVQAQISQTRKDIAVAQRDVDNYQALFNAGSVSEDVVIQYVNNLNGRKTSLQVLEVQLAQLDKSNTSNMDQQSSELSSTLKDLQIYQNKKAKNYLRDNEIICNIDNAIVKNIKVDCGSLLGTSAVTVMELIDADSIYINAEVEEDNIKDISLESTVRIVPTMNPELELTGKVDQIAAMAIEKDGDRIVNIQVKVDDPERLLKPGYSVDVYFVR